MARLTPDSHPLTWLALVACVTASLVLLSLPDMQQTRVAAALNAVLTAPYFRLRDFIDDVGVVHERNAELAARVTALELERDAVTRLRRERDELSAALGLASRAGGRLAPCAVVRRRTATYASRIQVRSAVALPWQPYQPVITRDGLLGRVRQVLGPRDAWIELLTAPDVQLACELERTGLQGVLRSRVGDFDLEMVGRDENVMIGDRVVTAGVALYRAGDETAGAPMPRGLPVGVVAAVESPPDRLFKSIRVEPLASFGRLDVVFVVLGEGDWFRVEGGVDGPGAAAAEGDS